ncbi:hypothetical protein [Pseudochryseolinea flava]|uniref:Viral A-type inclusion protein n=1 Tax=Pseudochryseolinea flava TaxID=2059302 RepID=A0A364Y0Y0_9BACT|nr:hypothetical protein [Pseudochryseolinea flava]RAV99408.1 hypothetical protein DQQ10_19490 [Pseudochryseolinea flava]
MKAVIKAFLFISIIALLSCGNKPQEAAGDPVQEESANAVLEREIDKIHMDAMEKMEEIQKIRRQLKTTLSDSVMTETGKAAIEKSIATLDSADKLMMDWMHKYNPLNDSIDGVEKAREYLENEMVKVKKLDAEMQEAIEKAKI